jgi:hypothetical protein
MEIVHTVTGYTFPVLSVQWILTEDIHIAPERGGKTNYWTGGNETAFINRKSKEFRRTTKQLYTIN